jgi:hypothetical protein
MTDAPRRGHAIAARLVFVSMDRVHAHSSVVWAPTDTANGFADDAPPSTKEPAMHIIERLAAGIGVIAVLTIGTLVALGAVVALAVETGRVVHVV